ncbi:MAG: nitroreductase family protein, partial [Rhodobacterales bacterium]|nr:nitroreductase family protein [Rhodobacterales bacterium]MDX5500417.1 nitroreductase family protein [Rhodobacterales bacterium]
RRFWRASFTAGAKGRENLRGRMAMDGHFLEYGLSLTGAEPGHGSDRALRLCHDTTRYLAEFGPDASTAIATAMLCAWADPARDAGTLPDEIATFLAQAAPPGQLQGGAELVTAQAIQAAGRMDFLTFARARHSIRSYDPAPVPEASVARAVEAAQQSPASCNRQTCRAHIWTDPALRARILALQNGNRGFGDQLGGVAVITSDLAHWEQPYERYQAWVDGGMFAMSFVYGLHAEGLGSVMLNWSVTRDRDRELRRLIGLPESELVITMVGFGTLPETLRVPVSQRRPVDTALSLNRPLPG